MKIKIITGTIILVVCVAAVLIWQFAVPKEAKITEVIVKGYTGSEKVSFLKNPEIEEILLKKYGVIVDFTSLGSIEQVRTDTQGYDFLWPSNEVALELYKEMNPGKVKSETVFNSPIVIYSWDIVVDALIENNYVQKGPDDVLYADIYTLMDAIVNDKVAWKDLGLEEIYGKVYIIPTDPTKSNSGNMFFGLLANIFSGEEVADSQSIETALPLLKDYYESLGFLEIGSGNLFKSFVGTGVGAKPIIVGYENQLIEFLLENPQIKDEILSRIKVIYPRPTVWASHPVIALTKNGETFMLALQDAQIQEIAWQQHGFRSGLAGVENDPSLLGIKGIPATLTSVMPLPKPAVMERLIQYLSQQ